jgi:hypothetical protein
VSGHEPAQPQERGYRYGASADILKGPDGKPWVAVNVEVQMAPPGFPLSRSTLVFPPGVAVELLKIALTEAERADLTARAMAGGLDLPPSTLMLPGQ